MSKCLGKSSAIFSTVFPNIIQTTNRYFQRIIKYMRSILPPAYTGQIHKSEILQKMGYFPYGNDTYTDATQKIVTLGKTNPDDAIDLLTTLNPFISDPTLYNNFIINMGLDSEESQVIQRFLQLSSMYIFTDTIPQILSFTDHKITTNTLLDSVLLLINSTNRQYKVKNENNNEDPENKENLESSAETSIEVSKIDNIDNNDTERIDLFECIEPFRSIFDQHWRIIIKKCSVIIGLLSIYDFTTVYSHFNTFLQNIDQYNARNVIMFRFIRIPTQTIRNHSFTVVDTIKKNHHNHEIMKPLISYLRFIAMQTDDSDSLSNILVAKKYAMKFPEYKQHTTEIDAIITSKKPNLSIDYFIEFITKLFSEVQPPNLTKKQLKNDYLKPKVQLRCFLYLLRGSKFDETFFWRGGENAINGRIDLTKEKDFMWNSNAPISRIFSVFKPFFEKIDCPSEYLIKSIFENFALRNVEQTISMISLFLLNSSESRILVLLQALSHIAEKHRHTFNETTKTTLFTLLQKYSASEISSFVISPPSLLESSISMPLDSNFCPEASQFINKIVNSADESDFYMKKQLPAFEFQRCSLNYQQNVVRSRRILEKITISLISLLSSYVTSIKSAQFIQILIGLSFSSKYNIAIFSLYAIEYLYFKYDDLKMTICDLIYKELIEISSDEKSLTFLSLLERLLSRQFPSNLMKSKASSSNSSIDFFDKLEAIILLHLSSPFIEVRMVCLNLSKFLKNSLFDIEIERIQKNFPDTKLPALKFEEICSSSCLQLYVNFYSEILLKLNSNDQKVIDILKSVDVTSIIRFSLNQQLSEIKPYSFQLKLLLFVMVYRLQSITKNQLTTIQQDIKRLSRLNYLSCYSIDNPFLSPTSDELHNTLKKSFSFLLSNITSDPEIDWPFDFLMKSINVLAFHPISVCLSILSKQLKTFVSSATNNENLDFVSKILSLLKVISQMPDLQLLLSSFPSCFDSIKGCFTAFESLVKKISSTSLNKEIIPLISLYAKIIDNVTASITADFEAGEMGSIHVYEPFEFTKSLNWSVEERYHTFFFFEKIVSNNNNDGSFSLNNQLLDDIEGAMTGLLRSGPVFRKASDFRGDLSFIDSCLSSVLPFHPFLFSQFAKECFSLNSVYFQAICDQIVSRNNDKGKNNETETRELTKREIKANINYFSKRAILLLLSSIFYELEKNFQEICMKLTRRVACLISVLVSPEDNSKIAKIFSTKNVLESIFEQFPFVASEVFIEGMNQLKLGVSSPVASQILDVLCKAAIHIDLHSKSLSFISHLVELYHSISRSFDRQYCDIFINFCKYSESNRRHLELSLFPLKRTDATKLILSSLIIEYPSNFIPRVVETTRLAWWFFFNVMKVELNSQYYIDCCIHLIEKLCETHFSAIEDYLTQIIHFCFLFLSSYQEIPQLLTALSKRMKVDIFNLSHNRKVNLNDQQNNSDKEDKSISSSSSSKINNNYFDENLLNEIDFNKAVKAFSDYFNNDQKEEWEKIALSWFVSCGDLHIAMKSGEIFCLLPLHSEEAIISICTSICSVMSFPSLKKHSIIIKYANRGFEMIRSVLEKRKVSTKMTEKLFRFLCAFIGTPDTKVICGFFTLLSFFVENPEMVEIMNLPSLYSRVVKYLNPSNDIILHSASLFLANTIVHVSDSKIRALSFCLLLPVIYSSLRISDNLDQQTTDEILHLMTSAQLGGTLPNIISNFIQIRETPNSFIDEIINDLYVNHLSDIELIGQYYAEMCEEFDDPSAVFDIALSLFKVSDKEWFIENFMGVVRAACKQKVKGLDLLAAITESYRGAMFTWKGILDSTDSNFGNENQDQQNISSENTNNINNNNSAIINNNNNNSADLRNDSKFSFDKLVEDMKAVVSTMNKKKKKIPVGQVSLYQFEDFIPMIPVNRERAKNTEELLKDVRQMSPEPLSTDIDDYIKLKQIKTKQTEPDIVEPKAETFKLHSSVQVISDELNENPTEAISADFFVPDDFDEFLARII